MIFTADDVLDRGLEGGVRARSQLAEISQDGVASLLRPGQYAVAARVADGVFRKQFVECSHIPRRLVLPPAPVDGIGMDGARPGRTTR